MIEELEVAMEMKLGAESTHQEEQEQQRHFHVLAVDDSLMDRKLLERQLLRFSSCHVTFVDSGDKALEYLGLLDNNLSHVDTSSPSSVSFSASSPSHSLQKQERQQQEGIKVNLIITDYCMPGMSGYDLLKRVKGSSWKDVPVVVMSSENIPSRVSICLEGGAEEFLLKPLQLSDVEKLQQHLLKSLGHPADRIDDNFAVKDSNNSNNLKGNNNNSSSSNLSTKQAMSPEPPEMIAKIKELAVV